jgi:hypothetical protein
VLLNIRIRLSCLDWAQSPVFWTNYIGKPLVGAALTAFFTPGYRLRPLHRCGPYLLTPSGTAGPRAMAALVALGHDRRRAENALVPGANIRVPAARLRVTDPD